jgi:hypothetical protein
MIMILAYTTLSVLSVSCSFLNVIFGVDPYGYDSKLRFVRGSGLIEDEEGLFLDSVEKEFYLKNVKGVSLAAKSGRAPLF